MLKKTVLTALIVFIIGIVLLLNSTELSEGIRNGLKLCSDAVIPSLFPFIALSFFICRSSASEFFSVLFKPITKLLRLPDCCGGILLCSVIGGYPSSAKCISDMVVSGALDKKSAERMLCFCVNASPPFMIAVLGAFVFNNLSTGVLLFCAQLVSSFFIAVLTALFQKEQILKPFKPEFQKTSAAVCLTESIISAAKSCFRMCAFILIACGISELVENSLYSVLNLSPATKALFTGFFEVTAGSVLCGDVPGSTSVILAGAITSFSGISVMLQIAAATNESRISLKPFIISRIVHSFLTAMLLKFFFTFSGTEIMSFAFGSPEKEVLLSASAPAAVSILCMISLFLLSIVPSKSETKPLYSKIKEFSALKRSLFKHN